jgi:hypothetical protein
VTVTYDGVTADSIPNLLALLPPDLPPTIEVVLGLGQRLTIGTGRMPAAETDVRVFVAVLHFRLEPMVRLTRAEVHSAKAKKVFAYRDKLRKAFVEEGLVIAPGETIVELLVENCRALPKSCFNKDGSLNKEGRIRAGSGADTTPDSLNLAKEIEDALAPASAGGDAAICRSALQKTWNCTDRDLTRVTITLSKKRLASGERSE